MDFLQTIRCCRLGLVALLMASGALLTPLLAQTPPNIDRVEYFVDTDPGFGLATAATLPAMPSNSLTGLNFAVNLGALTPGFHNLFMRSRSGSNLWSETSKQLLYIGTNASTPLPTLNRLEFFVDADPGFGLATAVTVPGSPTDFTRTFAVPLGSVGSGFHSLFIRSRDANGGWSQTFRQLFYIEPVASAAIANLAEVEYFVDNDPGYGNATSTAIGGTNATGVTLTAGLGALSPGFHKLFFRSRDVNGGWSQTNSRLFYVDDPTVANLSNINRAEYYFDTDPGYGSGVSIPIATPATNLPSLPLVADASALADGQHRLFVRTRDAAGKWSLVLNRTFARSGCSSSANLAGNQPSASYSSNAVSDAAVEAIYNSEPPLAGAGFFNTYYAQVDLGTLRTMSGVQLSLRNPNASSVSYTLETQVSADLSSWTTVDSSPATLAASQAAPVTISRTLAVVQSNVRGVRLRLLLPSIVQGIELSNAGVYYFNCVGPTITSFTPTSGPVGTVVTITGTDLGGATTVAFNGTAATAFTVNSATQITATVPVGATTGAISVTTPGGTATSLASFTVLLPPTISSFTPTSGPVGTNVSITGTSFSGATAVAFNGTAATFIVNSATSISTSVPVGATTGTISVTTPIGTATSSGSFTVLLPPTISSFTPTSGPVSTSVVITGTRFTGATGVTFNGLGSSFTVNSATQITATVPAGATTGPIGVSTPGGTAASASNFTVTTPPTITSFTPTSGLVGTSVSISGTNFSGATAVAFNGTAASFTVVNAGSITTTVPAGATTGTIGVTTPSGTATSAGSFVVAPPLVLGTSQTNLSCSNGSNGTATVSISGGIPPYQISWSTSPVQTTATATGLSIGTYTVTVTDALNQLQTASVTLTGPAPLVTSGSQVNVLCNGGNTGSATVGVSGGVGPYQLSWNTTPGQTAATATGLIAGSYTVTITDANLCTVTRTFSISQPPALTISAGSSTPPSCAGGSDGTATVSVSGGAGPYQLSWNTTPGQTTTTAMGLSSGTYTVSVTDANLCTATRNVTVGGGIAVVLNSFSPGSGPVGTVVSLNGQQLSCVTAVAFNGTPAAGFTLNSPTSITVTVPVGATTGPISLSNPAGPVSSVGNYSVTVLPPDLVVSTTTGVPGGLYNSITVTATGNGTLSGDVTVNSNLTVQPGGRLADGCFRMLGGGSFTLAAGATLSVCDPAGIASSGASGAVRMTGSRSFSNDASYVYNGVAAQTTGNGLPSRSRSLTAANAAGLTLTAPTSVARVLTVAGSGNFSLNGQAFTLLSDASGTALVVNSGSGVVQGAATVQRFIAAGLNTGRGYRHYTAPVSNATMADLATGGFTPALNTSYNTSATPGTAVPFPTVFGYDQSRLATAVNNFLAFDKGWFSPAVGGGMVVGQGYTVNIGANQLVDFVGTLNNGDLSIPLGRNAGPTAADAGWALVGNPYPAPLDWSLLALADRGSLDASIYVFESSSQYAGSYRAFVNGIGSGNPLIGSSQGFFVRVSLGQTNGTLTFRNSQRVTDFGSQVSFFRTQADTRPQLRLALQGASGPADDAFLYFDPGATPALDPQYDAVKLPNSTGLNLATMAAADALAINGLPALTTAAVVPLSVGVPAAGSYSLRAAALLNLPATTALYLFDAQTGVQTDLHRQPTYAFSVATGAAATGRFFLNLVPATPTGTTPGLTAAQFSVWPNPARTQLTVLLPVLAGAHSGQAELYNTLGQPMRTQPLMTALDGLRATLPVEGLATGMYLLRVTVGKAVVTRRVLVE